MQADSSQIGVALGSVHIRSQDRAALLSQVELFIARKTGWSFFIARAVSGGCT